MGNETSWNSVCRPGEGWGSFGNLGGRAGGGAVRGYEQSGPMQSCHQENKSNQLNQSLDPNVKCDLAGSVPLLWAVVCPLVG